jgi:hypothetical protein
MAERGDAEAAGQVEQLRPSASVTRQPSALAQIIA